MTHLTHEEDRDLSTDKKRCQTKAADVELSQKKLIVNLNKNVCIDEVKELHRALDVMIRHEPITSISIDGKNVEYIDTSGMQILMGLKQLCEDNDWQYSYQESSEILADVSNLLGIQLSSQSNTTL